DLEGVEVKLKKIAAGGLDAQIADLALVVEQDGSCDPADDGGFVQLPTLTWHDKTGYASEAQLELLATRCDIGVKNEFGARALPGVCDLGEGGALDARDDGGGVHGLAFSVGGLLGRSRRARRAR